VRDDLPTGTVTFLFTDVEGSTTLLHELGAETYADALAEHRHIVRQACSAEDGVEVDTQGDAFFFAFPTASGAVAAAQAITDALADGAIQLRIGLHTGTPLVTDEGYVGDDVHFAARVGASAHGGQVVLSRATLALVDGTSFTDLGEHRLKDIDEAVPIYQLGDESFPPLKTISNTNLPRPASSFVGRENELKTVLALIEEGARLVTLTGPGGSGKTRLALEAASTLVPGYPAGLFWVGLAALRDPALVTETIAQTLGAKDDLAEHIGERELLLLLDNLEQVIAAAPELSFLLQGCPNLTLLVTSRELLRVHGEVEYEVPPLQEPEAVSLFHERSQLEPSDEIGVLCHRLDSLPLAIELAAARTKALTPAQILERLSQRLDLFEGGRDADPRQQTLRATIKWSYELLSGEEQTLFRRLSVFTGGCTLEDAEDVCDANLDTLQSLVEKSLLRFSEARYSMLETIRAYATERLTESGEIGDLRRRHAERLVAFAEALEPELLGPDPARALDRVHADIDNIRAASGWARDTTQGALELRLAYSLRHYWTDRGLLGEGRGWLEGAAVRGPADMAPLRAMVLGTASACALRQGDLAEGQRLAEAQLEIARAVGGATLAAGLWGLAIALTEGGEIERPRALHEEAVAVAREAGPPRALAISLANLADLEATAGDFQRALLACREALVTFRRVEDARGEAHAIIATGRYEIELGRMDEGLAHARDGLLRSSELANPSLVAAALLSLADAARLQTHHIQSARLLGAVWGILEETGEIFDRYELDLQRRVDVDARQTLGDTRFEAAWAEGQEMTLDEAVEVALSLIDTAKTPAERAPPR
jgi:predicted ATPase/class 3 adenylate cyclase